MDEATWRACTDPQVMLSFLRGVATGRKLRLLALAACRRIWHLTRSERARRTVATAERHAEGLATAHALDDGAGEPTHTDDMACYEAARPDPAAAAAGALYWARRTAYNAGWNGSPWALAVAVGSLPGEAAPEDDVADERLYVAAEETARAAEAAEQAAQADLLRDIFGNPCRPPPSFVPALLTWGGGIVKRLAEAAYAERSLPGGTFDEARLSVLADALEAVGADADLVGHLREPGGVHVRGCWAVDAVLGASREARAKP